MMRGQAQDEGRRAFFESMEKYNALSLTYALLSLTYTLCQKHIQKRIQPSYVEGYGQSHDIGAHFGRQAHGVFFCCDRNDAALFGQARQRG